MKTALISGGNSGIGKEVAVALAKRGYRIFINGKDAAKTKSATEEVKIRSGSALISGIAEDISSVKGMKALTNYIKCETNSIEALVLSSGVILPDRILTADGLEAGFAVQYLSRFAVTQFLMAELKRGCAKIVHVGAPTLGGAQIYFDDLSLKNNFTMMKAMGQEMLANHLFVQEFAKRNPENNMIMNIGHVGIAKTGILRHSNLLFKTAVKIIGKSPDKACGNFVFLASDPAVNYSGYFLKKPDSTSVKEKITCDAEIANKLWNRSMELIN